MGKGLIRERLPEDKKPYIQRQVNSAPPAPELFDIWLQN
jgi:hypothetical protein